MFKNKVPEFLSAMFQKSDELRILYQRPPKELHELFEWNYHHVYGQATCEGCDRSRLAQRPLCEPISKIHYGLIASGDQVMRSATNAAEINGRVIGSILCFEMEAVGIMTGYSCIAIRGISDYADSHKNNAWQHYATAAAAACAKEPLSYLKPPSPFTTLGRESHSSTPTYGPPSRAHFQGKGIQNGGNISTRDFNIGNR
jgi:hypothetical protein